MTSEQEEALETGYRHGWTDFGLGVKSAYAWHTTQDECNSSARHYSIGYRNGWVARQLKRPFKP